MLKLVQSDNNAQKIGDEILIHIRYLSSGAVMTIDRLPPQLTAQEWRDRLLEQAGDYYQTFAGARGFFRLPRRVYDALLPEVTSIAAE
jgi:hypothetical protein